MQEIWFLCMARRLNVFYKCMRFVEISVTVIKYSPGRKYFNFSFILSLSKTVNPKVILVLSYISLILSTLSTGWSFLMVHTWTNQF